jgi:hypothetical protein
MSIPNVNSVIEKYRNFMLDPNIIIGTFFFFQAVLQGTAG